MGKLNKLFLLPTILIISQLLIAGVKVSQAQSGGEGTYQFLTLANSARIAAMGGNILAIKDNDVSLALANPSLIGKGMDRTLSFNFVDYYTDINYGFVSISSTLPQIGSYVSSLQFINYGKFIEADATGQVTGEFQAAEYAYNLAWGRELDSNFSIGAAFKIVYSHLASDVTYGLGVDIAGSYTVPDKDFTISLVARNAGRQLKGYRENHTEPFPFQMAIALSKRLKHLPFRYSIIYDRLDKYDLDFDDPSENKLDPLTNQPVKDEKVGDFFDNLGRHIIVGGEFLPSKNLSLRFGYNYGRRKELGVDTRMSTVGFSWGLGIWIRQFQFNYSRSTHHLAGSPNYVSIVINLSDVI